MGFISAPVDLSSPAAIGSTTPNTGAFTTLTLAPSANTTPFTASGYSLTGTNAQSFFDLSGTWNTSGTPTALKLNVTDTASNASSLLMDLQVSGSSLLSVGKLGNLNIKSPLTGNTAGMLRISNDTSGNLRPGIFSTGNGTSLATYGNGSGGGGNTACMLSNYIYSSNGIAIGGNISANSAPSGAAIGFGSGSTYDLVILRDASNTFAQRNSTNAQTFRLYRTYTDASNYERLGFLTTNSTRYTITSQNAGTGSARSLEVSFYTSSADPTSTDITSGCFSVWKNSGTGTIKLWVNDGGTMKSVALA